uniref:Proteasome subunit beta type-1 n=1 Tax=Ailuropoda melanoleuca TaxID=9646 RepID=G1MF80_AILME
TCPPTPTRGKAGRTGRLRLEDVRDCSVPGPPGALRPAHQGWKAACEAHPLTAPAGPEAGLGGRPVEARATAARAGGTFPTPPHTHPPRPARPLSVSPAIAPGPRCSARFWTNPQRRGKAKRAVTWSPCKDHCWPAKRSTVLAIAGEDFSIVASDTRLSEGYSVHTRDSPKCYKLTDKTVIGCSGFHGDCLTLTKIIEARLKMYKHSNNKTMTTGAIAAMLSTILYSRRFFPYYVYNIIGGLDEEGKGAVYSFDPVGSYQRDSFKAGGSASAMLQPLLDNQVGFKNMQNVEHVPLSLDRAMRLVKDVFISAAERDVYTGDALRICIVTKEGIREETVPLRKD